MNYAFKQRARAEVRHAGCRWVHADASAFTRADRITGATEREAATCYGSDVTVAMLAVPQGASKRRDLHLEVAIFYGVPGHTRLFSSLLLTSPPARSTNATKISNARLPRRRGRCPCRRSRWPGRTWKGPNDIAGTANALHRAGISILLVNDQGPITTGHDESRC